MNRNQDITVCAFHVDSGNTRWCSTSTVKKSEAVTEMTTEKILDYVLTNDMKGFVDWLTALNNKLKKKNKKITTPEYLVTYQFYTEKGERLAVFATPDGDGNLAHIHYIRCSKSDQFSKKFARDSFEAYYYGKPTPNKWRTVPVSNLSYCYKDFLRLCRSMFYTSAFELVPVKTYVKSK